MASPISPPWVVVTAQALLESSGFICTALTDIQSLYIIDLNLILEIFSYISVALKVLLRHTIISLGSVIGRLRLRIVVAYR